MNPELKQLLAANHRDVILLYNTLLSDPDTPYSRRQEILAALNRRTKALAELES